MKVAESVSLLLGHSLWLSTENTLCDVVRITDLMKDHYLPEDLSRILALEDMFFKLSFI